MDTPSFIAPLEVELQLDRTTLVVRPATVAQLGQLVVALKPLVSAIVEVHDIITRRAAPAAAAPDAGDEAPAAPPLSEQDILDIYAALSPYPDDMVRMVSILSGMKVDAVGALLPDRFVYLFAVLMQVNADFFARSAPVIGAARDVLGQAGLLPSGNAPSGS